MNITIIENLIKSNYSEEDYPALNQQINDWSKTLPLQGLTILDATPVFRNTTAKYLALLAAGSQVIVGISQVMPYDKKILDLLTSAGIKIVNADEPQTDKIDFILDCAASFIGWKAEKGYVELTRSGVDSYTQSGKSVYIADSSEIKKIETTYGTGESYFRALNQLGYSDFSGKNIVIYGSGKVGQGLKIYAQKHGMNISVISKDEGDDLIDCTDTITINSLLSKAHYVVTATGVKGAVESSCDVKALCSSSAVLANMGVEDEFGDSIPSSRVLEGKKPLNFILQEPTHMRYIDATMALHNYGAIFLNSNTLTTKVVLPDENIEQQLLSTVNI